MSDLYEITVAASEYPVTLADCKEYMKITSTAEDDLITDIIITATADIEDYTGLYFVTRTVQGDFDSITCTKTEIYPFILFRRSPLNTVTSVQALVDDTYTDVDYQIKKRSASHTRLLLNDFTISVDDTPYPLRVVTTVGYGAASTVPMNIKQAIMGYVNFLYMNRNSCIGKECTQLIKMAGFPAGVLGTINRLRIMGIFA